MKQRVAVTGGGGFVGQWLARALLARGDEVWLAGAGDRPSLPPDLGDARWITTDVRHEDHLANLFAVVRPDAVVHLAGISYVPNAESAPVAAWDVNVVGTVRLLTSAVNARKRGASDSLILVVGSGTQYGSHAASEMPLAESAEQRPLSSYAATKAAQETAALQIARTSGLRVICTRSFSHSGVGHDKVFLLPSLVSRVRELQAKPGGAVKIGNDVVRDYLHVDDAVSAYIALIERGRPGDVYNVCSGVGVTVRELAEAALARGGVEADIVSDSAFQRAADMPVLVGSPARLKSATGWAPTKDYRDIIDDLFTAAEAG